MRGRKPEVRGSVPHGHPLQEVGRLKEASAGPLSGIVGKAVSGGHITKETCRQRKSRGKMRSAKKLQKGFDTPRVGGYVSGVAGKRPAITTTHLDLFSGCSPPKDPHLDSRYRARGFPNHGPFSFFKADLRSEDTGPPRLASTGYAGGRTSRRPCPPPSGRADGVPLHDGFTLPPVYLRRPRLRNTSTSRSTSAVVL